jgi:hypothetical protein
LYQVSDTYFETGEYRVYKKYGYFWWYTSVANVHGWCCVSVANPFNLIIKLRYDAVSSYSYEKSLVGSSCSTPVQHVHTHAQKDGFVVLSHMISLASRSKFQLSKFSCPDLYINWTPVIKQRTNGLLKVLFVDAYLDWLGWRIFGTKDPCVRTCMCRSYLEPAVVLTWIMPWLPIGVGESAWSSVLVLVAQDQADSFFRKIKTQI